MRNRSQHLDEILSDLQKLNKDSNFDNKYAVKQNIIFFEALRSPSRYIKWIISKAPSIDGTKLLEISDLPFEQWDREMHSCLIEVQRKDFPGLIKPLVGKIVDFIESSDGNDLRLCNLGCGGMEVERQVIQTLERKGSNKNLTIVGVDRSHITHEVATQNLRDSNISIDVHHFEMLNEKDLDFVSKLQNKYKVILCKNDIFTLNSIFKSKTFDLLYHSLFRHHLTQNQQRDLDPIVNFLTNKFIEYDGFKSWSVMIPQSITIWKTPVLLNATIFSDLRYQSKVEIVKRGSIGNLSLTKIGTYLLEVDPD